MSDVRLGGCIKPPYSLGSVPGPAPDKVMINDSVMLVVSSNVLAQPLRDYDAKAVLVIASDVLASTIATATLV